MSCPTYLVALPTAEPADEAITRMDRTRKPKGKHVIVAQGNLGIPPLWLSLFDADDLVEWTMPRQGGEDIERYVSLMTTPAKGLRLLERRSKRWPFATDPAFASVLTAFRKGLTKLAASQITVEPYELFASAYDTKSWRKELLKWLKALDTGKGAAFDQALAQHFVSRSKSTLTHDTESLGFALAGGTTKASATWERLDVKVSVQGGGKLTKPARTWLKWIDKALVETAKRGPFSRESINLGLLAVGSRNVWVEFFEAKAGFSAKKFDAGRRIDLKWIPFAHHGARTREILPKDLGDAIMLDASTLRLLGAAVRELPSFRAIAEGKVRGLSFAPDAMLVLGRWAETVSSYQARDWYKVTWGGVNRSGLCLTVVGAPLVADAG